MLYFGRRKGIRIKFLNQSMIKKKMATIKLTNDINKYSRKRYLFFLTD